MVTTSLCNGREQFNSNSLFMLVKANKSNNLNYEFLRYIIYCSV